MSKLLAVLSPPWRLYFARITSPTWRSPSIPSSSRFRNALFDGYKIGEGIDPDLWAQFPLVEQAAEALGLVVWRMHEFETDDALATAAARWADDFEQVVICSPDKDFAQCVRTDKVVLLESTARENL